MKKMATFALAALMALGMFTACSGMNSGNDSTTTASTTTASTTTKATTTATTATTTVVTTAMPTLPDDTLDSTGPSEQAKMPKMPRMG